MNTGEPARFDERRDLRAGGELVTIRSEDNASQIPTTTRSVSSPTKGRASFVATLNRKHFPKKNPTAKRISPGEPIATTRHRGRSSRSQ